VEAMMRVLTSHGASARQLMAGCAMLGMAAIGVTAAPQQAHAWWRGDGWCCGVGVMLPPVIIAPPPVYAPAPVYAPPQAYYAPPPGYAYAPAPQRVWIPAHWVGGVWMQGHWR
jgi:hypothetical protein